MSDGDFALRIVAGAVCGVLVGLERARAHKIVGTRTLGLIALAAALLVAATLRTAADPGAASRVAQGLVTGVGFLGAGVILHGRNEKRAHGLTTAAAVWGACIAGVVAGFGEIAAALTSTVAMVAILALGERLDKRLAGPEEAGPEEEDTIP